MPITVIEFAKNDLGKQPVLEHLYQLEHQASTQKDANVTLLLKRLVRALEFVRRHGVPDSVDKLLTDVDNEGIPFTLANPVKALKHHPPIHELRVNVQGFGAYRALFFPYDHAGHQYLVFTRSVVKASTSDPAFDAAIRDTVAMLPDFIKNPRKYINL